MSESVNDYGLGAPNTQTEPPVEHGWHADPLAHGLGAQDAAGDEHGDEDFAEGGRHNRLEHGLGGAGVVDEKRAPQGTQPDPLTHGLGSPASNG